MNTETKSATVLPDPAAIFASALSLWQTSQNRAGEENLDLGECYNGMDQFMREIMRIANQFEAWACRHIDFNQLDDVWSYLLEDKFGKAFSAVLPPSALAQFDDSDCLRIAMRLRLPVMLDNVLPIPIAVSAPKPVPQSLFRELRILTVRNSIEDDEPFDGEYGSPYFGLYGVGGDGKLEHIADRGTYSEAVSLAHKIAPGVSFPSAPVFVAPERPI